MNALHKVYTGIVGAESDLCCYFFEQARKHIADGGASRAGLLATNSIRGIKNRSVLERINDSTPMFEVWDDEEWILDGANVNISIICFGNPTRIPNAKRIDGEFVSQIFSDLSSVQDLTKARRLFENDALAFMGDKKNGPFEISQIEAEKMLNASGNPNNRPNSDVVVRWITGTNFMDPRLQSWIIDFGTERTEQEASEYMLPFEYVKKHVYPYRQTLHDYPELIERWWIHGSPAYRLRSAWESMDRALATVRHTDTRIFRFIDPRHLLDSALVGFAIDDWFRMGVLESKVHRLWTIHRGKSSLEDRIRYTHTTIFQTFPFPRISPHLRGLYPVAQNDSAELSKTEVEFRSLSEINHLVRSVEIAAEELSSKRETVVREATGSDTFTDIYTAMPQWLRFAHDKLDRAVLDCYGLSHEVSEHEILNFLMKENLSRSVL